MAGMRGHFPPPVALKLAEVFLEEGISVFEFTMNSEQPIEAMMAVKKQYGGRVMAGMGTVLDVETARRVIDAGADFIVSPAFQPQVVEFVMKHDVFMVPGVITPTECVEAWGMGVKLLKLFPIGALGLDYFKAIYGPLSHMQFMMNGAMNAENGAQFSAGRRNGAGHGRLADWRRHMDGKPPALARAPYHERRAGGARRPRPTSLAYGQARRRQIGDKLAYSWDRPPEPSGYAPRGAAVGSAAPPRV
jgi:2-dehydro-3-deoxyphosphogluconate aldolase/(4S)-4-hydroxy-2-oxoglutarate aldolase